MLARVGGSSWAASAFGSLIDSRGAVNSEIAGSICFGQHFPGRHVLRKMLLLDAFVSFVRQDGPDCIRDRVKQLDSALPCSVN